MSNVERSLNLNKIYCANCIHCQLFSVPQEIGAELHVRCAAEKWKKKLGQEKKYRYSTIMRRCMDSCDCYESMGDAETFLRELRDLQELEEKMNGTL
ncbi:MAG: hypothetical protein LBQ77_03390 [Treponema sp.]|jgi:hypothetical protein|nr:hypothetical protein [Treponema sp.]